MSTRRLGNEWGKSKGGWERGGNGCRRNFAGYSCCGLELSNLSVAREIFQTGMGLFLRLEWCWWRSI